MESVGIEMDYLHIKSLEDYHPGYKDRKLQWCKAYFTMLNADPDIEMLCEIDKWRFLAFIMLELQMQKPVPLNDEWLVRKGFNIEIRPISLTLQMLHNFIEVYPTQSEMRVLDKSRVDKSRVEKSRVDKPPAELSKKTTSKDQPFKEPTTEQKQTLAKLHHTLSKPPYKFNIYNYISHVNKRLGYFPPIDSIINIANTAIKNKKDKLWGYFNNALKEEFPKRFAELNEKQGKNYKNEPTNMPQRLKDIFNK